MESLQAFLHNDLVLLFAILTLGCLLGRIKVAGVELTASGGVLFVALVFGHFHYALPDEIGAFGFAFFIYAIGFGAGPRFFQTFRKNGIRFGLVAFFVTVVASLTAIGCMYLFNLNPLILPGILAGSLTSTSTMAAAYEIVKDPIMSVGYGITYPFGLIGLLLMIQFLPNWLRINLREEAQKVKAEQTSDAEEDRSFQYRAFHVLNPGVAGIPLRELNLRKLTGIGIVAIKHEGRVLLPHADSILHLHDRVLAEGKLKQLLEMEEYIGPEVEDETISEVENITARVVINRKNAINRTVRDLKLSQTMHVLITRLQRSGIDLPLDANIKLERGDIVTITGPSENLHLAITMLGREEHKIYETDMFTFSAGLLLGLVLGSIKLPFINTSVGNAGGLIFTGILLGYLRNFGPFSGRVPVAARYILQELGLMLFLAVIGAKAGNNLLSYIISSGPAIFVTGALITTVTLITTLFFCQKVLRLDWNTSFGATTGGVTSTVALKIVTQKADSQYAVLGYAGVYAFANILLTLLGHAIVVIF